MFFGAFEAVAFDDDAAGIAEDELELEVEFALLADVEGLAWVVVFDEELPDADAVPEVWFELPDELGLAEGVCSEVVFDDWLEAGAAPSSDD